MDEQKTTTKNEDHLKIADLPEWWEYRNMVYWRRGPWRKDKVDSQIEASMLRSSENLAVIVRSVGKGPSKLWATFTREKVA